MSKIKCYSVRVLSYSFHENSVKLSAFDGSTTFIPLSMFFGPDHDVQKSDAIWVAAFIMEKSEGFQYSNKKVRWFEYEKKEKAKVEPEPAQPAPEEPADVVHVQGYFLEWRDVTLYIPPYGKRRDTKRQHIITYSGPSNQAPRGFVALSDAEFQMACKKDGKMIEPYTTPDFAKMIAQEKHIEEMNARQAQQTAIDAENKKKAQEKEAEEKRNAAIALSENIQKLKDSGTPVLVAWKQLGCPHPAPAEVVEAKKASGLNWKMFAESI